MADESLIVKRSDGSSAVINNGQQVPYLNADKLDGRHAEDFAAADHTHAPATTEGSSDTYYFSAYGLYEIPEGAVDSNNCIFFTSLAFESNSLRVWKNGLKLHAPDDFTEDWGQRSFTMTSPPSDSGFVDYIEIEYIPLHEIYIVPQTQIN